VRVLIVQAAWVVLIKPQSWQRHGLRSWIESAKRRLHRNVLEIALADKLARIDRDRITRTRARASGAVG
jgi:transposase